MSDRIQTFLPYEDFDESAKVLDSKRLNKQRVECLQILSALTDPGYGWQHHPAVNMWRIGGYVFQRGLAQYGLAIHRECERRGIADRKNMYERLLAHAGPQTGPRRVRIYYTPYWNNYERFHAAHRSNLLRKAPEIYRPIWPDDPEDMPYYWPTKEPNYTEDA